MSPAEGTVLHGEGGSSAAKPRIDGPRYSPGGGFAKEKKSLPLLSLDFFKNRDMIKLIHRCRFFSKKKYSAEGDRKWSSIP